jgi:hypothetical protein
MRWQFRTLVAVALVCHGIVVFVLPRFQFLFSADSLAMMSWGGHGARLAMNHPALAVLYLLPFPAFIGLYWFKDWARYLLLGFFAIVLVGSFFFGVSISGPPETFFGDLALLADGAILGLAFLSPLKESFVKLDQPSA